MRSTTIYHNRRKGFQSAGSSVIDNYTWEVHYDATVGVYNTGTTDATNGQTIETWADQSGNGNDLLGASAPYRPTYNSSAFGGLGGIDLVFKHFTLTNSIDLNTTVYTAFHVISRNGNSLWSLEGGTGGQLGGTGVLYGDGNMYAAVAKANRYFFENYGGFTGDHIYVTQAATSGVDDGRVWFDGVSSTPVSYAGAGNPPCTYFGRRGNNTGSEASNGLYGEFLLTLSVLSQTEIEEIETYLSEKWGLPIT